MQPDPADLHADSGDAADELSESADRLDELAETAELMGDADGAQQWHERALALRMAAMRWLDD